MNILKIVFACSFCLAFSTYSFADDANKVESKEEVAKKENKVDCEKDSEKKDGSEKSSDKKEEKK